MRLGILGGLGPAAGAHFYSRLIARTKAETDSEHIDVLLTGTATTPDRTAYLLGRAKESPLPYLLADARRLASLGADQIVLLCHTAHAFLPCLRVAVRVPILDMTALAMAAAAERGLFHLGVLCTSGSRAAGVFSPAAERFGIALAYPTAAEQSELDHLIYKAVKCGKRDPCVAKCDFFSSLSDTDALLLGCTELSLLHPIALRGADPSVYPFPYITPTRLCIDPIEVLVCTCIRLAGKEIREENGDALS